MWHSVPNGDPPEPFAENTKMCGAVLLVPLLFDQGFRELKIAEGHVVNFFSVIPVYQEEMDLKINEGLDPLLDRFDAHGMSELLDVKRPNTAI
jgi:hypothetical protein